MNNDDSEKTFAKKVPIRIGQYVVHERVIATDKPTSVLLVHGLGVSGDYYLPFARQFARYHNVYIIDLPGYGTTPKPLQPLSILELSNILSDYLEQKSLRHIVAVGQSMGCQIVAHAAASSPDRIGQMILLAPTVNNRERSVYAQSFRLFQDTFHEPLSATGLVLRDYLRMGIKRYLLTTNFMIADHIEATLRQCGQPTLIVRGEKDKIAPREWVNLLAMSSPQSVVAELSGAPHLLQFKKPEELVTLCQDFLVK